MAFQADFCLSCDKQTSDGAYCSQACRLADYDKAGVESPSCASSYSSSSSAAFHLTPAFDFDSYRSSASRSSQNPQTTTSSDPHRHQAKRGSVASFDSMASDYTLQRSNSTPASPASGQQNTPSLSEETRIELSRYETCFGQSSRRKPSRYF